MKLDVENYTASCAVASNYDEEWCPRVTGDVLEAAGYDGTTA